MLFLDFHLGLLSVAKSLITHPKDQLSSYFKFLHLHDMCSFPSVPNTIVKSLEGSSQ